MKENEKKGRDNKGNKKRGNIEREKSNQKHEQCTPIEENYEIIPSQGDILSTSCLAKASTMYLADLRSWWK